MHLDARRRGPAAVWQAGDDDAGACGAGDVEARTGRRKDGEADGLVDDGRGYGQKGAVLLWFCRGSRGLPIGVGGGCLDSLGGLIVGVNTVLCRIMLTCGAPQFPPSFTTPACSWTGQLTAKVLQNSSCLLTLLVHRAGEERL